MPPPMFLSDTYILAVSLVGELGMTLAYSYLHPPHLVVHGVLQSLFTGASLPSSPRCSRCGRHLQLAVSESLVVWSTSLPSDFAPAHCSSMSPALVTWRYPPLDSDAFCLLPFMPFFPPFLPSLFLFIRIPSLLRGLVEACLLCGPCT